MSDIIIATNKSLPNEIKDLIKIKYFLRKLPTDIIKKIWIEYIKTYLILSKLNVILNSDRSTNLEYLSLYNYLPVVFNDKFLIDYLIKNNCEFNYAHKYHIIEKKNI